MPTRKESFPTPADVEAGFVTAEEFSRTEKDISFTGLGRTEWYALLLETRNEAREQREAHAQLQRERDQEEERRRQERQQPRKLAQKGRSRNLLEALRLLWRNTVNNNNEVGAGRHGGFGVRRPLGAGGKKVQHASDPSLVNSDAEGRTAG